MKKALMTILIAAGLFFPAAADDFEDFIQVCARISTNYNQGIKSGNTRFDREYQMNLEHLKKLSKRIQTVIRRLGIGQDIDFQQMASELEDIYQGNQNQSGARGDAKLHPHSESPEGLLKVLSADVKALRKMGFTTEDGGSIKTSLETKRRLLEFRRLADFFRQNYTRLYKGSRRDVSLERIFKKRMLRMSSLSFDLMQTAGKNQAGTQSKINIHTETTKLLKHFEAWSELRSKINSSKSRGKNRHRNPKNVKRMDGLNTTAALRTEIGVSLRNLSDQLAQWEQSGFKSDDPISRNDLQGPTGSDPAAALLKDSPKNNYSAMSEKELSGLLEKRRTEIIRGNHSMDGFDRDSERKYLLTLSRGEKRSYNDFLREFQQQGYTSGQAVRSAILKIHTKIQLENKPLPAKEMIRILKALDKDAERSREKRGAEFKLERGNFERD